MIKRLSSPETGKGMRLHLLIQQMPFVSARRTHAPMPDTIHEAIRYLGEWQTKNIIVSVT